MSQTYHPCNAIPICPNRKLDEYEYIYIYGIWVYIYTNYKVMPHASKWIQPAHGRLRGSACEGRTCSAYQCDTRGCYAVTGRVQWERFARVGRCSALLDGCLRAAHPGAKGSPSRSSYTPVCKAQFVDRVAACKFGVKGRMAGPLPRTSTQCCLCWLTGTPRYCGHRWRQPTGAWWRSALSAAF